MDQKDWPGSVQLSPRQLSQRQNRSEKTLAHDRCRGIGVPFIKYGRICRYRLEDVLRFEAAQLRNSTSDQGHQNV